jgi:Transglycosylase-like domain
VIIAVRIAKAAAQRAARALARAERRQRAVVAALEARRRALASMAGALAAKQATYARARADRLAALQATRADRRRLEARLAALEAAQARYVTSTSGPSGPWAIPWSVVQCESGGQNLPPNWAGASGYYQIIPSTWRHFGGSGSAAWQASKGEQDRVATRIWGGGGGAHNWDCWSLIHRR